MIRINPASINTPITHTITSGTIPTDTTALLFGDLAPMIILVIGGVELIVAIIGIIYAVKSRSG